MKYRFALLFSALLAQPSWAQAPSPPASAPAPAEDLVKVAIDTAKGRIVLSLDRGRAPITTRNFLRYVDARRYDGITFYRALKFGAPGSGLVQAGITTDARLLYPAIAHESSTATGLKHVAGTVSMANAGPGTARADFFILTTDAPSFDASFAAFGRVVEGMDVINAILASPVSPTKGAQHGMQGQMLEPPVKIVKVQRLPK